MLTGWVCLYLFLVYVLTHGGKIQGWQSVVWVLGTLGGVIAVVGSRKSVAGIIYQLRISLTLTVVGLAVPVLFSWILGHFTDFSWDGMTSRGITVRNLMRGDPALNTYPFGHVLAGFLAHITGSWQGGKGINLALIWICFCFVFPTLQVLNFSDWKLWFLSIVTALNPVAVYQISCFQIDGHVASLITCLLFSMLRILASGPVRLEGLLALVSAFTASAACKTSGVFYAIIIDGIFLLFLAGVTRSWRRVLLLFVVAIAVSWPLGVYIRSIGQYAPLNLGYLGSATNIESQGYGVGSGASHIKALKKLDRIQQFIVSSCSYMEIIPEGIRLKPPFWMQRRELRAVEELTPDPRAGGFGPYFSTGIFLAGVGCLILVIQGQKNYWPSWFMLLSAGASAFGSQVWWARWAPQSWLLLIAMLMYVLKAGFKSLRVDGLIGMGMRWLGGLACLATGINVFLVTLYYFVGMGKQEKILNLQIELAAKLQTPVPINVPVIQEGHNTGASFKASKWWFVDRGVPIMELQQEPPRPRMKIHKTETRFPLPPDWRISLRSPEDESLFRKKNLIED